MVVLAEGWAIDTTGGPHFGDVPEANPFYGFIETAYNRGVISGYADGTFRPGSTATRGRSPGSCATRSLNTEQGNLPGNPARS